MWYNSTMKQIKNVAVKDFGKDHWSLLAYVGTRCVDYKCVLDNTHLRVKHPAIATTPLGQNFWKPEYSTRLKGYWKEDGKVDKKRMLKNHDDHDCLEDLEVAGFITNVGTMIAPYAQLTKLGVQTIALLIEHKTKGEHYATFTIE